MKFEAANNRFMRHLAYATSAVMCGLRSNRWMAVIKNGYYMASDADIQTFGLTDAEIATANLEGQKVYNTATAGKSCTDILRSEELRRLDELEIKFTGNYH